MLIEECAQYFGENNSEVLSLLSSATDDDPPIVLIWLSGLDRFVEAANQYNGPISCPFSNFQVPCTLDQFKVHILDFAQAVSNCPPYQSVFCQRQALKVFWLHQLSICFAAIHGLELWLRTNAKS